MSVGFLFIDVGNTRLKWSVTDTAANAAGPLAPVWQASGSAGHADIDTLLSAWRGLPISRIVIANVAGIKVRDKLQAICQLAFGNTILPEWFASVPLCGRVRNGYRDPAQLGCDRFAAAIGAHRLYPQQALLLASCGTATTIDLIHADGSFSGGMILPGLGLMTSALARGTAQLPQIFDHVAISTAFADNTEDAIISGCIAAQVGAIATACGLHRQSHPEMEIKCIVTGGSAGVIAPYLSLPHERVNHLVLTGLWVSIATER